MTDQPTTEAGRALLDMIGTKGWPATVRNIVREELIEFVRLVEQEAAATERRRVVERIRANRLLLGLADIDAILDEVTTP